MDDAVDFPSETGSTRRRVLALCMSVGLVVVARRDEMAPMDVQQSDLVAVELRRAAARAETCTAANAVGVGLRGEYFADESWRGASLLVRVDSSVDFDASLDWPSGQALVRPRSARWSGWVKAPISGFYRFHAEAPSLRVQIARQWLAGADAAADATLEMAAGRFYPISVDVSRFSASATRLRLEWTAPHGARFVVPRALLFLPSESIIPSRS